MRHLDIELPRHPEAIARARRAAALLAPGGRAADLRLVVSELVTNAVIHGQGQQLRLRLVLTAGTCRGEVVDAGHGFDAGDRPPRPAGAGGHGLDIVDDLCARWGAYEGNSTHVWFEL